MGLIIEREKEVGGTARSFFLKGFTFDFTGHLLHLHTPYTRKLITRLLNGKFYRCKRNTAIFSKGIYTPFPFQANTYGLPEKTIDDCILGFLEVYLNRGKSVSTIKKLNFRDWCQVVFGKGISTHFMISYNEKLYQTPSHNLTVDWCGRFVPKVQLEEVIRGALETQKKQFGYNATFLYPKKGGIQALAQALGKSISNIQLNTSIKRIDWIQRKATLSNGKIIPYKNLVNTIPLIPFLKTMKKLPASIKSELKKLKVASILCLNIGVKRKNISKRSWVYFPEKQFPFYRVGFPMNFTPHIVPKGCSSMYVEVPMKWAKNKTRAHILKSVRKALIEARILKPLDKLPVVQFLPIPYAYALYDKNRKKALTRIFSFLSKNGIQSIGRYGAWKYSFMEEAILDGKKAAETLLAPL